MWTKTSKECIEMKKQEAKKYFDLCASAYLETDMREKLTFPKWIQELSNDRVEAERGFVAIQAWLLAQTMDQGELVGRDEQNISNKSLGIQGQIEKKRNLHSWSDSELQPIDDAYKSLLKNFSYLNIESLQSLGKSVDTTNWQHALVTEAGLKDPAFVTPIDVAELMVDQTSKNNEIDIYAVDGLGLRFSFGNHFKCKLVGDEFGRGDRKIYPKNLASINDMAKTWYRHEEFINKQFLDLEWSKQKHSNQGDTLLVNASKCIVPFGEGDASTGQPIGEINHCIEAGYKKVVVLVSNHALTAGRGVAEKIFSYCLKNGLQKIIQLPMGVIGYKSQQHSIMVFGQTSNTDSVQFTRLEDESNSKMAKKGFGEPRRARALKMSGDSYWGSSYSGGTTQVSVKEILSKKKLISFEVGQFLSLEGDSFKDLRNRFEFAKLHQFMDIFRSHHMEEFDDDRVAEYFEISAGSIGETGWITSATKRESTVAAIEKREAQVLRDKDLIMCFRGSPDTFGKVGIYKKNKQISMPNQSFVILRMKENALKEHITPEFVLVWLRSKFAKDYLKSKSISPDVVRVAPKAIGEMEIPCGPVSELEKEWQLVEKIFESMNEMEKQRNQILLTEKMAWQLST
jgi:hypothetical protein